MKVEHQKLVSCMIRSAEGGTGLSHKIIKPTVWRRVEEQDAKWLDRCEEEKKRWAKHRQCDMKVQDLKDKPWRKEGLKSFDEGMPSFTGKEFGEHTKELQGKDRSAVP